MRQIATLFSWFLANLALGKRRTFVFLAISGSIFFLTTCVGRQAEAPDPVITLPDGNRLVGSATCKNCHADIYNSFLHTAHSLTSKPPLKKYIKGSFEEKKNWFHYSIDDGVRMVELDTGFFQANFKNRNFDKAYKFGMVIGSGTRGQTYLYWEGNHLFQLPVSYYTMADTWTNSPGYPDDEAVFTRPIQAQCLGCHSSYVKVLPAKAHAQDEFDHNSVVYGINCERCHGAGGKHVDFHTEHPEDKQARFIINAANLSQRQQLDACAVCHSGVSNDMKPSLGFITGDTIPHHNTVPADSMPPLDVHGNQYGLLVASKCFRVSGSITCSTCHNTHQQERGNTALFSQRCMTCHTEAKGSFCKMAPELGAANLISNCIDCHMPAKESQVLNVKMEHEANHKPAVIHSHYISIYPDETRKMVEIIKGHSVTR
ncbi:multiheme c-type cytochrome [Flavihumibacter profundi]|uniref:multiheme c-type cytochrome n=1 Tax=Flavihumibacter profundi TaxID=2716883 RepID=UPI001CC61434|nr:multiheme c-type cytochrome [Flavihumibacter profundi]MBZ5857390.1 hypothetical protein [Flavihumibacter profundi]